MSACLCGQPSSRPSGWCGQCRPVFRLAELKALTGTARERALRILTDAACVLEPTGDMTPPAHWTDDSKDEET